MEDSWFCVNAEIGRKVALAVGGRRCGLLGGVGVNGGRRRVDSGRGRLHWHRVAVHVQGLVVVFLLRCFPHFVPAHCSVRQHTQLKFSNEGHQFVATLEQPLVDADGRLNCSQNHGPKQTLRDRLGQKWLCVLTPDLQLRFVGVGYRELNLRYIRVWHLA